MCGIFGFAASDEMHLKEVYVSSACLSMKHRGPDDSGAWIDCEAGIALGHVRLSILDLSHAGHQPMVSESGRYVIVFNGEVYNHLQLRRKLDGRIISHGLEERSESGSWRGQSDTETLLAGFERWGIRRTLERVRRMFALALWDRVGRVLTLARDRLGEKPLYYGWQGKSFLFGSDLRALQTHPDWRGKIDRKALDLYVRHSCVPTPWTIFVGICKLVPGTTLSFRLGDEKFFAYRELSEPEPFWTLLDAAENGKRNPFRGTEENAVNELDSLLGHSVAEQMITDVPLGAFLSGGIDSTAVVALMQAQTSKPVKTFTLGFKEAIYNEAEDAKAVARHLGTEHTELYVSPQETMSVIPRLPEVYSEPFADSSQVPTFLISKLAREDVTVSLSGDGGDELFGGYNRHFMAARLWPQLSRFPNSLRHIGAAGIRAISPRHWDGLYRAVESLIPMHLRLRGAGDKLHKIADVLGSDDGDALYRRLISHWGPADIVLRVDKHEAPQPVFLPGKANLSEKMMALDLLGYLPNDILTKVDRAAMAVSLETRIPFLDHRVVEFAWRLPFEMKIRDGQGKWLLRQVLYRYVPKKLVERPKMGFGIPIDTWLRGPLREWAESLLQESRLSQEGFFRPDPIRRKWSEHLAGKRNWQYHLWDVLMFQAWFESLH
ncbi:MAG: asparagine synthase (glutamine-hydrolyzing) [Gammaproteobacteria bacterium]|nr:asparagine synthase (glutamine-hydrolyzing) [Gammaproteobacteria bacterium]